MYNYIKKLLPMKTKKKSGKNSAKKKMTYWEKRQRYNRLYDTACMIGVATIVATFWFARCFWGFVMLAFVLWSFGWYDKGAEENCVDEYEYGYPKDGFRLMFKSWPWFIGFTIIAYFFCNHSMPWLF